MRAISSKRLHLAAFLLGLLAIAGCARPLYVQTSGIAGPLQWEAVDLEPGRRAVNGKEIDVYDFTLVVRETRGIGLTFNNVLSSIYGDGWMGGGRYKENLEVPPFCELYLPLFSTGFKAPLWYVTLRGSDEQGRPVEIKIPVALPPPPLQSLASDPAKRSQYAEASPHGSLSQALTVAERRRIQIVDDVFDAKVFTSFFASEGTRKVASLSGATVVFDPGIEPAFQRGLRNIAGGLMSGSLHLNSTIEVPLEFPPPFGTSGIARFTYATVEPKPEACRRVVIIETLNSVPEEAPSPADFARFQRHGFHLAPGWTEKEQRALYAALRRLSDRWLSQIEGLTFNRDKEHPAKLGGEYQSRTHTITMYDSSFTSFDVRFDSVDRTVAAIAHELGHVFDLFPLRHAAERYKSSLAELSEDLDEYKSASSSRPSAAHKLLETQTVAGIRNMEAARSLSGYRWVNRPVGFDIVEAEDAGANEFRRAAESDGPIRITKYAEKSWSEYFAECFSFYVVDPELLDALRPNIYAYFAKRFPR